MAPEATRDVGVTNEIEDIERKIAELRSARAQMVAEREEHDRNAARASTVLGGLAQIHRELGLLVSERAVARDSTGATCEIATSELARIDRATESMQAGIADLEARLAMARETSARVTKERIEAERAASEALAARDRAMTNYEETARAFADVAQKYEAALAESSITQGRDVQFSDIEETLDREQDLAETRLRDARARAETMQVEAELRRIRELEDTLVIERAELERRLHAMRSSIDRPVPQSPPPIEMTASLPERAPAPGGPEPARISLAARLLRDLANPRKNA